MQTRRSAPKGADRRKTTRGIRPALKATTQRWRISAVQKAIAVGGRFETLLLW